MPPDEFQISSRELEAELEKELEATEAKQADLRQRIQRLDIDKEDWKVSRERSHWRRVGRRQGPQPESESRRKQTSQWGSENLRTGAQ